MSEEQAKLLKAGDTIINPRFGSRWTVKRVSKRTGSVTARKILSVPSVVCGTAAHAEIVLPREKVLLWEVPA